MHPLLQIFSFTGVPKYIGTFNAMGFEAIIAKQGQTKCSCGRFTRHYDYPSGITVRLTNGAADTFQDLIQSFEVLISRRVLQSLKANGCTGYIAHPVTIGSIESKILRNVQPPDYYFIEITGQISVDRGLLDEFDGDLCPECGAWRPRKGGTIRWGPLPKMPLLETWDESDFVKIRNVSVGNKYCSRKIVELGRSEKWTAFGAACMIDGFPVPDLSLEKWDSDLAIAVNEKYPNW